MCSNETIKSHMLDVHFTSFLKFTYFDQIKKVGIGGICSASKENALTGICYSRTPLTENNQSQSNAGNRFYYSQSKSSVHNKLHELYSHFPPIAHRTPSIIISSC